MPRADASFRAAAASGMPPRIPAARRWIDRSGSTFDTSDASSEPGAIRLGGIGQGLTPLGKPASAVPGDYDPKKLRGLYSANAHGVEVMPQICRELTASSAEMHTSRR
jgi:hypothetical protein